MKITIKNLTKTKQLRQKATTIQTNPKEKQKIKRDPLR